MLNRANDGTSISIVCYRSWYGVLGILKVIDACLHWKEVFNNALGFLVRESSLGVWGGLHEGRLAGTKDDSKKRYIENVTII